MSMANPEPEVRYSGKVHLHIPLYLISGTRFASKFIPCAKNVTKFNKLNLLHKKLLREVGKKTYFSIADIN
jgi:hypothetical protein